MRLDDHGTAGELDEATADGQPSSDPVVVGIGASAGGLGALQTFFAHVPEDSGLAYVVVVHLSPDHESHLADLLQPFVGIPVEQVTRTIRLEPNRVYVIPPNANLNAIDTHLRLTELEKRRRERAPIDHFFRTLARTHDGHAIGVILTGSGSDGALGIKAIKERGGLAVVQDPNEAEYDGMPRSAVGTGLVDVVLPLAEMPSTLIRFARTQPRVRVNEDETEAAGEERRLLRKVFAQLRAGTGRDFSRYKRSTILRRIARRMQLNLIEELPEYLELLRRRPEEVRSLADDLLITVTSFFRDPEVFETVAAEVLPRLFEGKGENDSVRVWSVGCATGEEAYSLAILLLEERARHDSPPRVQVFATDLHEHSLGLARDGFYPSGVETEVSPGRLQRYFTEEGGGYRIRKGVRDLIVFSPHNLLSDPPFSRIDLITCRNLLIYLQRDVQREVIEVFHYALEPDGVLLLGSSETVEGGDLFRTENKKRCLYRKRDVPAREPRLPVFPLNPTPPAGEEVEAPERAREPLAYGRLHQRMVERYAPPSVLVSPDDKVVHLSEHAGRYLVPPGGEPTMSVYKLVREELRLELRAGLHAARARREPQRSRSIGVRFDGVWRPVVLDVRPAIEPRQEGFALVIFDEREPSPEPSPSPGDAEDDAAARNESRVREVEAELDLTQERLQGMLDDYETSQEEMRASNEELQSSNEELRSALEELETNKEELQSMNEELQTVNQENRNKVEELAQLTGDLQNLLAATDIATLFLDRGFRILWFTPNVSDIFNVRATDRGRPISDLTHRLGYPELQDDAEEVLRRLTPVEREVEDDEGRWYLTRVLPYRSADDRIEGVVITLVDITARKRAEEELRRLAERMEERIEEGGRET